MTEEQNKLVIDNMNLVYHLIKKFNYDEDYASIGMIGLIKGVKTFDKTKGYQMSTYLCRCILIEIYSSYRYNRKNPPNPLSLDDYSVTENIKLRDCIQDESVNIEEDLIKKENSTRLKKALEQLSNKERKIIISLYGLYGQPIKKQVELSLEYNISQSRISKIHKIVLKKLKRIMESD